MSPVDSTTAADEGRHHTYRSGQIPWSVHLVWIAFWCFVAYYAIQYIVPMIQSELASAP